ncbi:MAG TPA: hypothetical protein VFT98_23080 [Myxococcota bacterium]|nr:hypothetical protein [Myxococcota bacterium]
MGTSTAGDRREPMDWSSGVGEHERRRIVLDLCAKLGIDPHERSAAREALGRIGGHLVRALAQVRNG